MTVESSTPRLRSRATSQVAAANLRSVSVKANSCWYFSSSFTAATRTANSPRRGAAL